jgi:hypothetical protein
MTGDARGKQLLPSSEGGSRVPPCRMPSRGPHDDPGGSDDRAQQLGGSTADRVGHDDAPNNDGAGRADVGEGVGVCVCVGGSRSSNSAGTNAEERGSFKSMRGE